MFSSLSHGSPLFVLEKGQNIKYTIGQVDTVSTPHPRYPTYTPGATYGINFESVVDITAIIDGKKQEFKNLPSASSVANFETSNFIVSDSREAMIAQVDALLQSSKQILESVEKHKGIVKDCDAILKQLNPNFAKEADRDNALASLSERVNSIQTEFGDIKESMKEVLTILKRN